MNKKDFILTFFCERLHVIVLSACYKSTVKKLIRGSKSERYLNANGYLGIAFFLTFGSRVFVQLFLNLA